jgi:hypothetical protein
MALWQPKSFTYHSYSKNKLLDRLNDLHPNPSRAGVVKKAEDWRWS